VLNILVVEDNTNLRKLMTARLEQEGYPIFQAENGEIALDILETQYIDLIICDIMMPHMNGYELTKSLRESNYNMPILMVTAKESFEDKEKGFLVGTDDYMVKPINMNEMVLRVGALLRRAKISTEHKLNVGDVVLDYDALTVTMKDMVYELPKKEFYLLFKLLSYPKQIFTRQQLMDEIWGMDVDIDERTVDSHIKKLRKKLEKIQVFKIITIRGLGYKVEKYI
jgi:two-component system OmpR family response regulator